MDTQDHYSFRLLTEIEAGQALSQRGLASNAGIALGLTNLLVRRLAKKGFVKIVRVRPNRVRYLNTPAGLRGNARSSREYLRHSVRRCPDAGPGRGRPRPRRDAGNRPGGSRESRPRP